MTVLIIGVIGLFILLIFHFLSFPTTKLCHWGENLMGSYDKWVILYILSIGVPSLVCFCIGLYTLSY
jgi:hypothetical protein